LGGIGIGSCRVLRGRWPLSLTRFIRAHRPAVVFILLVLLSVGSLLTGAESTFVGAAVKKAVTISSYPFLLASNRAAGAARYVSGLVSEYDSLRERNEALHHEVVRLRLASDRLEELGQENRRLRRMLRFAGGEPRLGLEAAHVIESYKGMLRIDRGSVHGVEVSMCAIAEAGIVGIVTEAGMFSSVVATLHHPECKVGVMVQRNRLRAYDGVIHASGDLRRICTMDYIDMKDEVRRGDSVVTSPESLFPSGYPVGVVSAPPRGSGTLWKSAEVAPAVDPYKLDEVFIIRRAVESVEELAGGDEAPAEEEAAPSMAAEMPDARSPQERYAP